MTTGWFDDPYGRHEARWISEGVPTSLVRDGKVEKTDPPPEQPIEGPLVQSKAPGHGPTFTSDLRRSDDAERSPSPQDDQYRTLAFDTMARPGLWHPGEELGDPDTPIAHRRRLRGVLIFVVGLMSVIGGLYLIQTPPKLPTHRFTPTATDLGVLHTGGTAIRPSCPETANPPWETALGFTIGPSGANTQFTVYPMSDMLLPGVQNYEALFSASAPICEFASGGYYVERPGRFSVYFISTSGQVSVVRVVVIPSGPPAAPIAGWVFLAFGGLACTVGVVLMYRRRGDGQFGNRFPRADDAQRAGGFDPKRAQRTAWDVVVDQQAGQF